MQNWFCTIFEKKSISVHEIKGMFRLVPKKKYFRFCLHFVTLYKTIASPFLVKGYKYIADQ